MAEIDRIIEEANKRKAFWRERNDEIKRAFDIIEMVDKNAKKGYESTVVSDLRAGFNVATHILSTNPMRHKMPFTASPSETVEMRDAKNGAERLIHSNWRIVDSKMYRTGRESFQRQLAQWPLATGWYGVYHPTIINRDGTPNFQADVWDISELFPEWGGPEEGMVNLDRQYVTTKEEYRRRAERAGWIIPTNLPDNIVVLDHWENRYNRLDPDKPDILNGIYLLPFNQTMPAPGSLIPSIMTVQELMRRDEMVRIPISVGAVNGIPTPSSYFGSAGKMSARQGQSMLVTAMESFETLNRFWKYVLEDARTAAIRTYILETMSQDADLSDEAFQRQINILQLDPAMQEKLTKMDQTTAIGTMAPIIDMLNQMLQRALFPWTQFGQTPFELSGVAIERLNEQAKSIIGPTLAAMQFVVGDIDRYWINDWKRLADMGLATQPVRAVGRIRGQENSGFYDEEISAEKLPDSEYMEARLRPALPMDRLMQSNIARLLIPQGDIVDLEWVLDEVLDEQDPATRMRRVNEEKILKLPQIVMGQGIIRAKQEQAAAESRGDDESAQVWQNTIQAMEQQLQNPQLGQGGQANPPEQGIFPAASGATSGPASPSRFAQ